MNDFKVKKGDIIVVFVLIILSVLPLFAFTKESLDTKDRYAVIYVNAKKYKEIKLGEDIHYEYEIKNGSGVNFVEISGYEVLVHSANCSDQICVKQGVIIKVGQSIVCLPNRIFIEIIGKEPPEIDDISR